MINWSDQNRKRKKPRNNRTCCFPSCGRQQTAHPNVHYFRIPPKPNIPAIPAGKKKAIKLWRINYEKKLYRHNEFKKVLGQQWCEGGRVCSCHKFADVEKVIEGESVIIANVLCGDGIAQTEPSRRVSQDTLVYVKEIENTSLSPGKIFSPATRSRVGKHLKVSYKEMSAMILLLLVPKTVKVMT